MLNRNVCGALAGLALAVATVVAAPADAAYVVTFAPSGNNVVATGAGSIDTAGLTDTDIEAAVPANVYVFGFSYDPTPNELTGSGSTSEEWSEGTGGPATLFDTTPGGRPASSGSGDLVGIGFDTSDYVIFLPVGYVSGAALSDTATYDNVTISDLGLIPGTYTWSWGSGAAADSFELIVADQPIPEPTTLAILGAPLALLLTRRRSERAAQPR